MSVMTVFLLLYHVSRGRALSTIFKNLNLHKAVVNNYYLRLAIFELFNENGNAPVLTQDPFPVVLVAAPLQIIVSDNKDDLGSYQTWPKVGAGLIDALSATLAVPGLYEPVQLNNQTQRKRNMEHWFAARKNAADSQSPMRQTEGAVKEEPSLDTWILPEGAAEQIDQIDLVDGSVIRQNPLPALFNFISQNKELATALSSKSADEPKIHVVYSVPIDPAVPSEIKSDATIVNVGLASVKLSRRRDTQLEVHQTNLLSRMELQVRKLGLQSREMHPIFVNEIAPESDTDYKNPLNPTRDEVLTRVASGCRATLERLYGNEISAVADKEQGFAKCEQLISIQLQNKDNQRHRLNPDFPGLPEVCQACTRMLKVPGHAVHNGVKSGDTWSAVLPENPDYPHIFPQLTLTGENPRIVFVASGGVFRGTFHAGMLAALLTAHIKPDLIVGASVGTIMGGVLAAAFSADTYAEAVSHLAELTSVLLAVDKNIAFTKPFKNAVRDLGIRARDVQISPNDLRKMVLRGSERDPTFGTVGAPSALIDGLSHLLLIPHRNTGAIAAEFVAGHVTQATKKLLQQLNKETLRSLNIEFAVIGTSLLQPTARRLLAVKPTSGGVPVNLGLLQPYQEKRKIAVYGTTINYWEQRPVLLGAGKKECGPSYDFVEAVLCSSAFPCVFATRRESDLYPGTGLPTTLFCDGGMFDNLPFLPAIQVLAKVESTRLNSVKAAQQPGLRAMTTIEALEKRQKNPDLFIAGSLNVNLQAQNDIDNTMDDIIQISKRASALQYNVKIKSFEQMLFTLDEQLALVVDRAKKSPGRLLEFDWLDKIVNAAVLPVYPSDQDHLNGTFAFCASTGMKQERLKDSISNGCFQTLRAFVDPGSSSSIQHHSQQGPLARSLAALKAGTPGSNPKLPAIDWNESDVNEHGQCKYFLLSAHAEHWPHVEREQALSKFKCPFFQAAEAATEDAKKLRGNERKVRLKHRDQILSIYERCIVDETHLRKYEARAREKDQTNPPKIAIAAGRAKPL